MKYNPSQIAEILEDEAYRLRMIERFKDNCYDVKCQLVHVAEDSYALPQSEEEYSLIKALRAGDFSITQISGQQRPASTSFYQKNQHYQRRIQLTITGNQQLKIRDISLSLFQKKSRGEGFEFDRWNLDDEATRSFVESYPAAKEIFEELFAAGIVDCLNEESALGERGAQMIYSVVSHHLKALKRQTKRQAVVDRTPEGHITVVNERNASFDDSPSL